MAPLRRLPGRVCAFEAQSTYRGDLVSLMAQPPKEEHYSVYYYERWGCFLDLGGDIPPGKMRQMNIVGWFRLSSYLLVQSM